MSSTFPSSGGGGRNRYCESLTEMKICPQGLATAIAKARAAHPELRLGQVVWIAASMARRERACLTGHAFKPDSSLVFCVDDDTLAVGLDMMMGDIHLPSDEATQVAEGIKSYLTRKTGLSLDGEAVSHIAKLIRGDQ